MGAYKPSDSRSGAFPLPRSPKAQDGLSVRSREYVVLCLLPGSASGEHRMDCIGHEHFAAIRIFGCSRFKPNCALLEVNLRHSEIKQFRDSPTICSATFHQSAEPKLCSVHQCAVLAVIQESLANVVFLEVREGRHTENLRRSRLMPKAKHSFEC